VTTPTPQGMEAIATKVRHHLGAMLPDLVAVYVFGSAAKGTARADSDVDIGVLTGGGIDPRLRMDLQESLALELGVDVDLVDLRQASCVMRAQVIGGGRLIVSLDDAARQRFEMYSFSDYARLNEERAAILQRVAAEGSVYGR
jgi:uncharacterized protein